MNPAIASSGWERGLAAAGAFAGLLGVAVSARASHSPDGPTLEIAGRFLLFHAPALLALAAAIRCGLVYPLLGRIAGIGLAVGLVLFCGDLSRRAVGGVALLPLAAPAGGILLMTGWALLAIAALLRPRPT